MDNDLIFEALHKSKGNVALAARMLGYSRPHLHVIIKNNPDLAKARDEARKSGLEWAESKLFDLIEGDIEWVDYTGKWVYRRLPDLRAIMFYLTTQHGWSAPKPELDRQTMKTLQKLVKDIQKQGKAAQTAQPPRIH